MKEKLAKAEAQERRLKSMQKSQSSPQPAQHSNIPGSNTSSSGSDSEVDEEEHRDVMTLLNPFALAKSNSHADLASLSRSPDRPGSLRNLPMSSRSDFTPNESEKSSNSRSQLLSSVMHQQQAFLPVTSEDIEIIKSLHWVEYMLKHKQFFTCLRELPTIDSLTFSKDELSQVTKYIHYMHEIYLYL